MLRAEQIASCLRSQRSTLRFDLGWVTAVPSRAIVCIFREQLLMTEGTSLSLLTRWENFYVIVGSSAGALTGLQFVVIALIAEAETSSSMLEVRAFGTPTVVHFCASLLISAILSAPWH